MINFILRKISDLSKILKNVEQCKNYITSRQNDQCLKFCK